MHHFSNFPKSCYFPNSRPFQALKPHYIPPMWKRPHYILQMRPNPSPRPHFSPKLWPFLGRKWRRKTGYCYLFKTETPLCGAICGPGGNSFSQRRQRTTDATTQRVEERGCVSAVGIVAYCNHNKITGKTRQTGRSPLRQILSWKSKLLS